MAEVLVPLSMALITEYNEEQLGIAAPKNEADDKQAGEKDDE